jgi:hypothetical protein
MSLITVKVLGDLTLPSNVAATGRVEFALSSAQTDGDIVVPAVVSVPLVAGAIDVDLWPNNRGQTASFYEVLFYPVPALPGYEGQTLRLGQARISDEVAIAALADVLAADDTPRAFLSLTAWLAAATGANAAGRVYTTTAAGLAATTTGQYWLVLGGSDIRLWLNSSGVANLCVISV